MPNQQPLETFSSAPDAKIAAPTPSIEGPAVRPVPSRERPEGVAPAPHTGAASPVAPPVTGSPTNRGNSPRRNYELSFPTRVLTPGLSVPTTNEHTYGPGRVITSPVLPGIQP